MHMASVSHASLQQAVSAVDFVIDVLLCHFQHRRSLRWSQLQLSSNLPSGPPVNMMWLGAIRVHDTIVMDDFGHSARRYVVYLRRCSKSSWTQKSPSILILCSPPVNYSIFLFRFKDDHDPSVCTWKKYDAEMSLSG